MLMISAAFVIEPVSATVSMYCKVSILTANTALFVYDSIIHKRNGIRNIVYDFFGHWIRIFLIPKC